MRTDVGHIPYIYPAHQAGWNRTDNKRQALVKRGGDPEGPRYLLILAYTEKGQPELGSGQVMADSEASAPFAMGLRER